MRQMLKVRLNREPSSTEIEAALDRVAQHRGTNVRMSDWIGCIAELREGGSTT